MKVTITDEALREAKSFAERQKIRKPVVYLDVVRTCCSSIPKVSVADQTSNKFEIIDNSKGIPICACDLIREFLKENEERNDLEIKVDIIAPYGLSFQLLKLEVEHA